MRLSFTLTAITLVCLSYGQVAGGRVSCIVQIRRDSLGANIVKVTLQDPDYPASTLRSQIENLGKYVGSDIRGLLLTDDPIDPANPESKIVRATFGVDGLVDRHGSWVKVGPLVKAMAGAPSPHQITSMQVDFDYEKPMPTDLDHFSSDAVDIVSRTVDQSLEYDIKYKLQDPSKIDVPEGTDAVPATLPPKGTFSLDYTVLTLIAVAILASVSLVYFLFLLKPGPRKRY